MNKQAFLLMLAMALLFPATLFAGVYLNATNFPDANFRSAVSEATGVSEGYYISDTKISSQIDWSSGFANKSIKDVKGIEYFTSLKYFYCNNNAITKLDVSKNTRMTYLVCNNNQITEMKLPSMSSYLQRLYCYENQLTSLDVSYMTVLTHLYAHKNKLTQLDVEGCTSLSMLTCYNNELTSLDVSTNTSLGTLACYTNELTTLNVNNNKKLSTLSCQYNKLTSISVSGATGLTYFACSNNQLTALDVSKNTLLTTLSCDYNQIASLNVTTLTELTNFACDNNQLTSLDVTKNTSLTYLAISFNQLKAIDLSKNLNLQDLPCGHNLFTSLDVTGLTKLKHLCTSFCEIAEIKGLEDCTLLEQLYVNDNQLMSLDVSKNTALTMLHVQNNHLIQLDGTELLSTLSLSHEDTYHHHDEYPACGWGGTNQTRTMPAELVERNGEWTYRLKMPTDATGKTENFIDNQLQDKYVVSVQDGVEWETVVENGDTVTYFYLPYENAPKTFTYIYNIGETNYVSGTEGSTEQSRLQVIITPIYPDAMCSITGAYRSKFLPAKVKNSYKNTIVLNFSESYEMSFLRGKSLHLVRTSASDSDDATNVATLTFDAAGESVSIDYDADAATGDRFDSEARVESVAITSGETLSVKLIDYFLASTAEGGDQNGSYTYSIEEDAKVSPYTVPVYASYANANLYRNTSTTSPEACGYSYDEVLADTEHTLLIPDGVGLYHSEMNNPLHIVNNNVYKNASLLETITNEYSESAPYFDASGASEENTYSLGMVVNSEFGRNEYGTNEVAVPVLQVSASCHSEERSVYTFHGGNSRYFKHLLDIVATDGDTESVGYRVWRTTKESDEEYTIFDFRKDEWCYFSNLNASVATVSRKQVNNVGSEDNSQIYTNSKGVQTVINSTTGVFGSKSAQPEVKCRVRAYYRMKRYGAAAEASSVRAATSESSDLYYVAETQCGPNFDLTNVVTGIEDVASKKEISHVKYYNVAGQCSDQMFEGMNIVVTTYKDGTINTSKVIK